MQLEFIKPIYSAVKSVNGMTGDVVIDVPKTDLTGYATEEYVAKKVAEAALSGGDVDLSAYYTKSETEAKIDEKIAAIPEVDLRDYAKKTEIPDVSNFATQVYVNEAIAAIEFPEGADLTGYATEDFVKAEIEKIPQPDLKDYALKTDVPDVSNYQTADQVQAAITTALGEIGVAEEGAY